MDVTIWIELAVCVMLLGFSGFFSSSETALFSLGGVRSEKMPADGNKRVGLIKHLLSEPRRLIATILIGNECVNVAASVLAAATVFQVFGAENKWIDLLIMAPILLLVGEFTPKALATRNNAAFAAFQSVPVDLFARLIGRLRRAVRTVADFFTTLIVGAERSPGSIVTEDMVRTLADEAVGEGALDHTEAQLIDQFFEFNDRTIEDLTTPREQVTFAPVNGSGAELLEVFRESKQSRMPVFGRPSRQHRRHSARARSAGGGPRRGRAVPQAR